MVDPRAIAKASIAKASITTAVLAIMAVWGAAPAAAGEAEYLQLLQDRYPFLSTQQLLTEGHRVCTAMGQGVTAANAVGMVENDLSVTVSVGYDIVGAAAVQLGC